MPAGELPRGQVEAYLADTQVKPSFGGKVFCVPDVLGTRLRGTPAGVIVKEYVYADCQEYYPKAGHLELGTGAVLPVVITARRDGNGYSLVGSQTLPDGGGGREIFPPLIRWRLGVAEEGSPDRPDPSAQAAAYFRL